MDSLHRTKKTASYPLCIHLNNIQLVIYLLQMPKIVLKYSCHFLKYQKSSSDIAILIHYSLIPTSMKTVTNYSESTQVVRF